MRQAFRYFDRNGDGKVTLSEFATALQVLQVKPSNDELVTLFGWFDPNGTGKGQRISHWKGHSFGRPG